MQTRQPKQNLLGLSQQGLEKFLSEIGERSFHARQVMQWIHQRKTYNFDAMTDLSKSLREHLIKIATIELPTVISMDKSSDGTIKWLFESGNNQAVESVFIPEPDRGTLCISSQVGCALDCTFCATGAQGFNRNLGAEEIIGQVSYVNSVLPRRSNDKPAVTNVVFMGMGEPLANYRSVIASINILISDYAYGISRRRITVSTSGIVANIAKLSEDCNVSLAVSLHAPNNELRDQLVPINRIHPVDELLEACWEYAKKRSNRFITFEYVMLKDVNDSMDCAIELAKLLEGKPAKVNLIPFNSFPGNDYVCSPSKNIRRFQQQLRNLGIVVTTRKTRGADIHAACGQLTGKVSDKILFRLGKKIGIAESNG